MKILATSMVVVSFLASLAGGVSAADAGGDVGLVNALQGDVSYQGKDGPARKAQAYMRLRHGDKIVLASGASIRISYTTASRQESWTGPGSFVATSAGGELLKGNKPEVSQLPAAVPQKLARVSELMNTSRVGGLVVRSAKAQTSASKEEVAAAVATYESMRAAAAPTDVTPELFLYSVFQEHGMIDDLKIVAREMMLRQPDNAEIQQLAKAALAAR
ncbi:hypothetical protein [Sulfuritalea sp.]|uniref:hypothetical protein n=1 Tax=Sulfuritalea sp. TaxID=2480090 RepID=UPI001AC0A58C|nr:hypothetical protein [Sulfuritalea sp.]MBN8475899.1 hypothetical protein [Sulfuritalea sp.]